MTEPRLGIIRAIAIGTVIAIGMVIAMYAVIAVIGTEIAVAPPGQPSQVVPLAQAVGAAVVGGLLISGLAAVTLRLATPRRWFLVISVAGLVVSLSSPLVLADSGAAAGWLSAMHVAVAGALIPLTARALPATGAGAFG
ncbi:MAG: DUF6069 family protein [Nocardioides sp.]